MQGVQIKEAEKVDGRHARVESHKAQVISAMMKYIRAHNEVPTADVLAELAGVSRRSVFRLFEDRADLLRATSDFAYRKLAERLGSPDALTGPGDEPVSALVDYFAEVFEFIAPFRRVAERTIRNQELVELERERYRSLFLERARTVLAPFLPPAALSSAIVRDSVQLVMSWKAWDHLRLERSFSVEQAKEVMLHTLRAVLRSAGAAI